MDTSTLLLQLGYTPPSNAPPLDEVLRIGLSDDVYREIVLWLTKQIKKYAETDETVSSVDDPSCFALEISSLLKELTCPFRNLLEGPVSARFRSEEDALLLIDYLVGECIVGSIDSCKWEKELLDIHPQIERSTPSTELRKIFEFLDIDQIVSSSVGEIFDLIQHRLSEHSIDFESCDLLFHPDNDLTDDQWVKLDKYYEGLQEEYNIRRLMMTKRLDLTLTSFMWKQNNFEEVSRVCRQKRRSINALTDSMSKRDMSDLLVANQDLLRLEKVASTRLKGSRKNVFLGHLTLPNRGGVVSTHAKPWMPIWSSREEGQPCENLRQKHRKQPKEHSKSSKGKEPKRKQRKDSGDI